MGARQKLNSAAVVGCVVIAGLVGAVGQSWVAFWLTLGILITGAIHDGSIRPTGRGKP